MCTLALAGGPGDVDIELILGSNGRFCRIGNGRLENLATVNLLRSVRKKRAAPYFFCATTTVLYTCMSACVYKLLL